MLLQMKVYIVVEALYYEVFVNSVWLDKENVLERKKELEESFDIEDYEGSLMEDRVTVNNINPYNVVELNIDVHNLVKDIDFKLI